MKRLLITLVILGAVVISIFSVGLFVPEPPQAAALSFPNVVGCWVWCVAMSGDVDPEYRDIWVADCVHYNCL